MSLKLFTYVTTSVVVSVLVLIGEFILNSSVFSYEFCYLNRLIACRLLGFSFTSTFILNISISNQIIHRSYPWVESGSSQYVDDLNVLHCPKTMLLREYYYKVNM